MGSWLEHLFALGHGAWWGRWELWQLAAVATGGVVLLRASGRHTLGPYGVGVATAAAFALLVGGGAAWAAWALARRGPPPEIEIAGTGAFVGLAFGFTWAARRRGLSAARALDQLAPAIGPMLAVARVGCFYAGCEFGAPSHAPWAMRYPAGTAAFARERAQGLVDAGAAWSLSVHPSLIYELAAGALLAVVAAVPLSRDRVGRPGARFMHVLVVFAVPRACTDLARGDLARGSLGLTSTQWLALAAVGGAVAWHASRAAVTPP